MNWASLLLAIQQMDPITAVMATVMIIFFTYRGGANLIPKFKKVKDKKEESHSLLDLHRPCQNFTSFQVIIERVMVKSDQIFRLKYQDTLYEQMNEAELLWDGTKDLLRLNFAKTFDLENPKLPKEQRFASVDCYSNIIDSVETEILGLIRRWMRKNHFMEKSEIEYETYITEKTKLLYDKMTRLFDDRYNEDRILVKRDVIKRTMTENSLPTVTKNIHAFFLKAKATAREKDKEIKKLEAAITMI